MEQGHCVYEDGVLACGRGSQLIPQYGHRGPSCQIEATILNTSGFGYKI